jgi:signal transduction histidine kinase
MDDERVGRGEQSVRTVGSGVLEGAQSVDGEMRKELAVLHRVFRHNFRNQLNTIRGHAKRAQSKTDDPEATDSLDIVLDSTAELIETVEEVTTVDQLASSDALPEVINLTPVLTECVECYEADSGVEFETEIPDGVWVWANPALDRALRELIENAIQHNDAPTPRVSVRVAEGQTVEVRITDNGPGMPPGTASVLESTGVDSTNHLTSLSLWIAYWAITRSGGTLTITNNEPRGCQLDITLRSAPTPDQN